MNKFENLTDKLIKGRLWSSDVTLIQLNQSKDTSNKIIYSDGQTATLKCVKKDLTKKIDNDKFEYITVFYFSVKSLSGFDLTKNKFAVEYNGTRYFVTDIQRLGTMRNQDALVKMVVKR